MAQSKEMTSGPSLPLILNFTFPLLLGNLLQQTYSLVDAAIVGKFLGINALASVGASTSVVFLILGFCNGCCGGFGIPVAQKFGARDYVTMRRYVSVSLKLAAVMSVAVAIVTSLLCGFILRSMRTPENIFEGAYLYRCAVYVLLYFVVQHHPCVGRQQDSVLVPAFLYHTEHCARFVLHPYAGVGSGWSSHCYGLLSRVIGLAVLYLYVPQV